MKIGIAGYGKMGRIREQSILKLNEIQLTALYDINQTIKHPTLPFCQTFEALLEKVDAVFISTYVKDAAKFTIQALEAGKHVFCEKPPAMTASEVQKVIQAEKKSNKILKYGFNHRYHDSVANAKRLIESGKLGKILWIRCVYGKAGSIDFHENWRNYKQFSGGGILLDQGIHMLDLMRYLSGEEFTCLSSHLTTSYWDIECEDNAFLTLKSQSNGIIGTLHSSATQWKHKFLMEITLEEGYINLDGILSSTNSYAPETMTVGQRRVDDISHAMGKPEEIITNYGNDVSWDLELKEFLGAISKKHTIHNGTSNDAYEVMKIVDHVYQLNHKNNS